ncbi:MAG: hypothetical protein ACR2QO_06365 [Acidimicrobiales bacterium]
MATKPGEKVKFEDLGVEIIVTKGGDGEVSATEGGDGLKVGKRYECESAGIQVLVTKPGAATLMCNSAPMALQEPKKTKSAD